MAKEQVKMWRARIERAKSVQSVKHGIWRDSLDLYNCVYFSKHAGYDPERVDVHFANWYVNNFIPLVYFRDPYIFVKSRNDRLSPFAETLETAINVTWKRLDMKQQFKRVILSAALQPPGWIKVGYTAKIGQDVAQMEEYRTKNMIREIKDTVKGIFRQQKEPLTPEEQGVLDEYIEEENVFATWVPSWNILMPEGYHLIQKMPYLFEREDIPLCDFLANPFYKNKDKIQQSKEESSGALGGKDVRKPTYNDLGVAGAGGKDNEIPLVTLYHIWDRRSNKRLVITDYSEEPHFEGDWSYDFHGYPYEPLIFEETLPGEDSSNPYPCNILEPILPQIIEQSNARTQMVKWRKRSSALILAQRGMATEEDMRQLEQTEGVQIVTVSNIGAFQMSQTPNLPQNVFDVDGIIKEDLQMGTNMGQLMFAAQPGQRTATQAQISQSGLQLKAEARVDVVEDFTVKVARKLCLLMWQFFDKSKIEEIIGEPVTDAMWIPCPDNPIERKKIMSSEMMFMIDAGSTSPPKDETVDRKQLLDFTSIVATVAPDRIKKGEFTRQLANKFKFVKDVDKVIMSDEEEEQKIAQEENQLLAQGIPQIVGPNEIHEVHIKEHMAVQGNEASDSHIQQHGAYLGVKQESGVSANPQQGDIRPPGQSSNPEIVRQGAMDQSDIYQATQNVGVAKGQ